MEVLGTTLGAPAMYRCNQGFELVGEERRVCTVTGEWSDEPPVCRGRTLYMIYSSVVQQQAYISIYCTTAIECPNLSNPANGRVSLNGITVGSLATYECDPGFVLRGNERRSCLSTGRWSGSDPECVGMYTMLESYIHTYIIA